MIRVAEAIDFEAAREIFLEYARTLPAGHVCVSAFEQELAELPDRYCLILLDYQGDALAACVAMRRLDPVACEMKRLYVRTRWRGRGISRQLVMRVLDMARQQGFGVIRLDTLPEMSAAQCLYRSLGFREIPRYGDNPVGAVCLELSL